jgi:hypothetical protein
MKTTRYVIRCLGAYLDRQGDWNPALGEALFMDMATADKRRERLQNGYADRLEVIPVSITEGA